MPASARRGRARRRPGSRRSIYIMGSAIVVLLVVSSFYYLYFYSPQARGSSTTSTSGRGIFYATIATSQGIIKVELYNSSAPKTVTNFIHLAQNGFYTNLAWHRIVAGFAIQTGDPNSRDGRNNATWGQGSSPQTVPLEIDSSLHNTQGYLAMARGSDPSSGSSQFFINLADNSAGLDGKYTVFGRVISGMGAVQAIASLPVSSACAQTQGLSCQPRDPSQAMVYAITISTSP